MLAKERLKKIPEEQHDAVKAVYSLLMEKQGSSKVYRLGEES